MYCNKRSLQYMLVSMLDGIVSFVNAPWYVTNDILHYDLNVPYVRNEIKKLSRRDADRLKQYSNILAIDLMGDAETSRRLKRKLPQDLCI